MEDWYVYPSVRYEGDVINFYLTSSEQSAQRLANQEEDKDEDERLNRPYKQAGRHLPVREWIYSQIPPSTYYIKQ